MWSGKNEPNNVFRSNNLLRFTNVSGSVGQERGDERPRSRLDHHANHLPAGVGGWRQSGRVHLAGAQEACHQGHLQPLAAGVLQPAARAGQRAQAAARGETHLVEKRRKGTNEFLIVDLHQEI